MSTSENGQHRTGNSWQHCDTTPEVRRGGTGSLRKAHACLTLHLATEPGQSNMPTLIEKCKILCEGPALWLPSRPAWPHTHLSQGAFTFSQEVVVTQLNGLVVDVINPELQFLNHFKVVVNNECLGERGIQAVLNPLRALGLCPPQNKRRFRSKATRISISLWATLNSGWA